MDETTASQQRDPWSFKGLIIGAWRSVQMYAVGTGTLDRRELEKLDTRWQAEDAERAKKTEDPGTRSS